MSVLKTFVLSVCLFGPMALSFDVAQAQMKCSGVYGGAAVQALTIEDQIALLEKWSAENVTNVWATSSSALAYRSLKSFRQQFPQIDSIQNGLFVRRATELLVQEELSVFHQNLNKILTEAKSLVESQQNNVVVTEQVVRDAIEQSAMKVLSDMMTVETARAKSKKFFEAENNLRLALGEMSAEQFRAELLGPKKDPRNIAPESLVGRYLSEAAEAKLRALPTEVRQFNKGPTGSVLANELGPERLYVPVDLNTFPIFEKYFVKNPVILMQWHTVQQGTLYVAHNGRRYFYAGSGGGSEIRVPNGNLIFPMMIMSTTEASRMDNYFKLGSLERDRAKIPWGLSLRKDGEPDINYCGRGGGYTSCTHWIGELPFGDLTTNRYRFPGVPDQHAYNRDPNKSGEEDKLAREYGLSDYNYIQASGVNIGYETRIDRLTRMVWKSENGPQQLWEVLNTQRSLDEGEWANPGFTMYGFLGSAPAERVPVVFVNATDARTLPTLKDMRSQIYAY